MSEVTQLVHHYLRHNKKFPHVFCPGCGHGIVLGSLIRSVHSLGLSKDEVVLVSGIGCSGRIGTYVDFSTVHAVHGRALTLATGIKLANPKLTVITIMGDGDAMSIGGNHFIHAARRNIGLSVLALNNFIYGMTGGQASPTTPLGGWSTTTPYGRMEPAFDLVEMSKASGAAFVSRATSFHAQLMDTCITESITSPGFGFVEILTPCHTHFGRKNKYKTAVDMYRWLKDGTYMYKPEEEAKEQPEETRIPIGAFVRKTAPGLETLYEEDALKRAKQSA